MAAKPKPPAIQEPPGTRLKLAIEKAKTEGAAPATLLLQLTHRDVSLLKRDRRLADGDISFVDGAMHYLGVKIVEGETASSELVILQD